MKATYPMLSLVIGATLVVGAGLSCAAPACRNLRSPSRREFYNGYPDKPGKYVTRPPDSQLAHGWWGFVMTTRDCQLYFVEVCSDNRAKAEAIANSSAHARLGSRDSRHVDLMGVLVDDTCAIGRVGREEW